MALTASEQFSGGFVRDADGREVVTFTLSGSAYDAAVLTDSPVAYWLLNDPSGTSAADNTGNGHTGTYTGAGYTLGATGPCSDGEKAVTLSGTDYITVPHSSALAIANDITLEGWVNMSTAPAYSWLICKDSGSGNACYDFALRYGGATPVLTRASLGSAPAATSGVPTSAWTHVAVTGLSGTVTYYINGAAAGAFAGAYINGNVDSGTEVVIGTRNDHYLPFVGGMAKVAVYNTALSGARIAAHYAAR